MEFIISVTVTLYAPADKFEILLVVEPVDQLNEYGDVPPKRLILIDPVLPP
jgi:hypothetical protein